MRVGVFALWYVLIAVSIAGTGIILVNADDPPCRTTRRDVLGSILYAFVPLSGFAISVASPFVYGASELGFMICGALVFGIASAFAYIPVRDAFAYLQYVSPEEVRERQVQLARRMVDTIRRQQ